MNALFGSLTNDGLEEATDRIGGFQPFDSGIYTGTIKLAYAGESQGGAKNVTIVVDMDGKDYRETIYITNKKGENFFYNKQDPKKKVPLPGFTTIDDICLVTTGKPLCEQPAEDKVVNVYDADLRREVPKSVPMLVDLLGKQVSLGILRQLENKSEKDGAGNYIPTADTRETNAIDKVFHTETKMTVAEARASKGHPEFWITWSERNAGVTRDRREIKDGAAGQAGRPAMGRTPPQAGTNAPAKSLFGN